MNRRESLKALSITTLSTGLLLAACKTDPGKSAKEIDKANSGETAGLQDFEIERLKKLNSEQFFTGHELLTITVLADIIIPKDEVSGSASDAKVTDFIEFIVKDIPEHQVPMRGGLKWLDLHCLNRYSNSFKACTQEQQLEIVKEIAYPLKAKPEMQQGVFFFNLMRSLTASGFYTSKIGITDIGYLGNAPGKWEGVPADVLAQYNMQGV
jgi:hypothetical protein